MKRKALIAVFISAAAFLIGSPPDATASAGDMGWVLSQRNNKVGDGYIYCSPNGLKLVSPKTGFTMSVHAPDWDINIYNDRTRVIYHSTLERWIREQNKRMRRETNGRAASISWMRGETTTIGGMQATEMAERGTVQTYDNLTQSALIYQDASFWLSDQIKIPARIESIVTGMYGIPDMHTLPLRLTYRDKHGQRRMCVDTFNIQQIAIPVSYYNEPRGYRPVRSSLEVMMTPQQQQMLNDLEKDMQNDPSGRNAQSGLLGGGYSSQSNTLTLPGGYQVDRGTVEKALDMYKQRQGGEQ